MNSSACILFLFFSLIAISQPTRACFSSIISIGGSPSDTGNELIDLEREIGYKLYVGYLPNGETFFGHPTGRFCDGRIVNDFIAEEFGLPYPPPHMAGAGPENQYFKFGVNVAIAGSTLAETSFFKERGTATPFSYSISAEVQWLKDLLPNTYCSSTSDCGEKLANALFIVGPFGRNDFRTEYLHNTTDDEIKAVVLPVMVDGFISALKELVDIGARTMIIANSYPIGCLPASFVESPRNDFDMETGCMNWLNDMTSLFHRQLESKLQVFQSEYPHVTILYADLYGMTIDMILSPKKYGIQGNPLVTCCGGGGPYNYNLSARCGDEGARKACEDPSKALFWDGVHLTEARYKFIAAELVKQLLALPPIKEQCKDIKGMNDEPFFM